MISEQTVIDILYFILHDVFQTLSYYAIVMLLLTPKYKKSVMLTGMIVLAIINICCQYITFGINEAIYFIFFLATIFVPGFLFFKEKKKTCFFALSIVTVTTVLLDSAIAAVTMKIYGFYPTKTLPYTWDAVVSTLIMDAVMWCGFALVIFLWRKRVKRYSIKSTSLFMLFPLGQSLFIAACTYPTWKIGADFDVFDNPFMLIAFVVSLVSDVLMFIALRDNNNLEAAKARAAQAEREMENQLRYYSELTEKMTEIREYRHDINNLVAVAEALITESSSQNSRDFIGEMKNKAEAMKIPVYSSSEIANTVLWKKGQEAKELGVSFTVKIDIKEDFPIDKIDVCSLLANLLDNAVDEAKETDGKTVEITAGRKFGLLMIEVVNSADEGLEIKGKNKPKTSKTGDHGHGLEIVERIAEKYRGKFVFEAEGGQARANVSLVV